jgi:hypothetical protein
MATEPDYRKILLNLCASLTLADHLGDVCGYVCEAMMQAGVLTKEEEADIGEMHELASWLHELGATTLYGTSVGGPEE